MTDLQTRPDGTATIPPRPRAGGGRPVVVLLGHAGLVGVALTLWALALPGIDLATMNGYGLISVLPVGFFAGIGLVCLGFAVAVVRRHIPRLLIWYPFVLMAMLHAVVPLVYPEPRYSYVYKHIAVARYISEFGGVDRTVDIYHNWPGVFAASAMLSDVTGVDPAAYANWADVVFAGCGVLAVCFLARSLTTDGRRVAVAAWLYVIASCGSQVYFAPQSFAFFLVVVALGIAIRWLGPVAGDRSREVFFALDRRIVGISRRVVTRIPGLARLQVLPVQRASLPGTVPLAPRPAPTGYAVGTVLLLASAVVVTHQLSPVFLAASLGALVVTGRLRVWFLPVVIGVLMAVWVFLAYDYVSVHFTLFSFDPFDNIKGTQAAIPAPGSPEFRIVALAARIMIVLALAVAAVSWWLARPGRRETFLWLVALAPAGVLLVQSYGGEALYRVVMFMLPWVCFLASRWVVELARRAPTGGSLLRRVVLLRTAVLRIAVLAIGSAAVAGLFLLNHYGLDRVNNVAPQEVRASAWFETNAPSGAMLAYLNGYSPTPSTAYYSDNLNLDGNWGGGIFSDTRFQGYAGRPLTAADISGILQTWKDMSRTGQVYVFIGPTQLAAVETYGYSPPGTIDDFVAALLDDPRFRIVYSDLDAYILEVVADAPG